jgi:hypothetical protein
MPVGEHGRSKAQMAADIEKQGQVLALRKAGLTFERIAQQLGYADRSGAYVAYQAAMKRLVLIPAAEERDLMAVRLDDLLAGSYAKAIQGDPKAVLSCLRILDRRARLLGLDAPTKVSMTVSDPMVAEIERLALELGVVEAATVDPAEPVDVADNVTYAELVDE